MKLSTIFFAAASAGKKGKITEAEFNEFFGNLEASPARFTFSETDSFFQQLQFYLQNAGKDFNLAGSASSYGCWCQLRNENVGGVVPGHGAPVDSLDAACRLWHQCKSCTISDFTDESCDPNNSPYEIGFDPVTMRIDCQFNPSDCTINNCKCDEQLAHALTQVIDDFSEEFVTTSEGGFDYVNECKAASPGTGGGNGGGNGGTAYGGSPACCGEYPNRFSYNDQGGKRGCCGDVTFNTYKYQCCSNALEDIGTC